MELTFKNPGIEYMLENIMGFQGEDCAEFWSAPLYHFYPQLDRDYANKLNAGEKRDYLSRIFREIYQERESGVEEKARLYAAHWERCKEQITAALSEAFEIDCSGLFNDMVCNVSLNPVEPRFLQSRSFDIFWLNSERGAVGGAIHEIIHFVWFYVWNRLFGDTDEEYEAPSLKWILSEMAVEAVMRDERLSSINPYFPQEAGGCVYPYFYTMRIEGRPILDKLYEMYSRMSIAEFMRESYEYCLAHEAAIRSHIAESERNFS